MKTNAARKWKDGSGRAPTVEKATNGIREKIFSRDYPNGFQLTETMLADEYRISRGSIRSALFVLEKEGLISTQPNGRKIVLGINVKYVEDIYATRAVLECKAITQYINRDGMDYAPLARTIADFYSVGDDPDLRAVANSAFHRTLVELADMRPLTLCWETLESSLTAVNRANYVGIGTRLTVPGLVKEHTDILDMLIAKDPGTFDALSKHVMVAKDDFKEGMMRLGWL